MFKSYERKSLTDQDRENLLNLFFHEYTVSLQNNKNILWVQKAGEVLEYLNNMRVAQNDADMRQSMKNLFGDYSD